MVIWYRIVGVKDKQIKLTAPRYFPKTISFKEMGLVDNNSKVPIFFSSLNAFIVIAGISIKKTHGVMIKNDERSAKPLSNTLNSPGMNQSIRLFTIKNNATTKNPTGVEKKELISLFNIAYINLF